MSMQAPMSRHTRPPRSQAASGAQPASFVSQLKRVEHDLDEAQHLMAHHRFAEARARLVPHLAQLPQPLAGAVYLVLGQCAMRSAGHNWPALLNKARGAYQATNDAVGLAHTRLTQGQGFFARGELSQTQSHLSAALRGFTDSRVSWGQAMTQSVRAHVFLAQHDLENAMASADHAVGAWAYLNEASEEAMARQTRAQLLASAGRMQDAARDLLWAERLVGPDASADVRTQLTLGRADSLLWMGYAHRAQAALSRVAKHAEAHPDVCVRAHFHKAMGQALMVDAPVIAAQHLNTAVDALRQLGHAYGLAQAQIYLACCEHRLSLPTHQRLEDVRAMGLGVWPVLRDALAALEPILQAPPGRLTGPQPPKVFDPAAIADAPDPWAPGPVAQARGVIDPAPERTTDDAVPHDSPWTGWMSRVTQAFASLGQARSRKGRLDVHDAPAATAPGSVHVDSISDAPQDAHARVLERRPDAAPKRRAPAAIQAEITQA